MVDYTILLKWHLHHTQISKSKWWHSKNVMRVLACRSHMAMCVKRSLSLSLVVSLEILFIPLNSSEVTCESDTKYNVNCAIYIPFSNVCVCMCSCLFLHAIFFLLQTIRPVRDRENVCMWGPIWIADVCCLSHHSCTFFHVLFCFRMARWWVTMHMDGLHGNGSKD